MLKGFFEAVGVLVSREELGREAPLTRKSRPSLISLILQPEELPAPAVSVPPRRTPLWRWLLMPEKLPPAVAGGEAGTVKSFFGTLFGKETLPRDPVPEKGPRSGAKGGEKGKTASGREE